MEWEEHWSKSTKQAYNLVLNKFNKKNPWSKEAKKKERRAKKTELYANFKKQQKELEKQYAAGDSDDE